jgi:hypothetical protein
MERIGGPGLRAVLVSFGKTWPAKLLLARPSSSHPPPSHSLSLHLFFLHLHNTLTRLVIALTLFTRCSSLARKSFFPMLEE